VIDGFVINPKKKEGENDMYNSRQENYLNVFFGEDSLKNKSFTIQQGDYNSNEVVCNLYTENESGKND